MIEIRPTETATRMRFIVPDQDKDGMTRSQRRELARRQQAIRDAHIQHDEALRPLLPPSLQILQELRIDDAHMRRIVWDSVLRRLFLSFRHSNKEYGAFLLHLRFHDVELSRRDRYNLRLIARQGTRADVRWWEMDRTTDDPPRYVYRLSWNTRLEIRRETADGVTLPRVRRRLPWWRGGHSFTWMLPPEIELRFAALDLEIVPDPPEPEDPLAHLRYWAPERRRDRRRWLAERQEERQERLQTEREQANDGTGTNT